MVRHTQPTLSLQPAYIPRQPVYTVWPPRVESEESLNLLMAELARLAAWEQHVDAEAKERTAAITSEVAAQLVIEVEGRDEEKPLTVADWRAKLEGAAQKFCDRHRESLLESGLKSRDLTHGRFGWRDQKAKLVPLEDFPAGGNSKLLDPLLKPLRAAAQKLADFFTNAARFVDLKLTWRKTELLKAWHDGELNGADLRRAGFAVDEPGEQFFIEPKLTGDVASQSAEKPK